MCLPCGVFISEGFADNFSNCVFVNGKTTVVGILVSDKMSACSSVSAYKLIVKPLLFAYLIKLRLCSDNFLFLPDKIVWWCV